MIRLN